MIYARQTYVRLLFCRQQMHYQHNQDHMCIGVHDLLHDMWHEPHISQDRDLYTFYLHKPCHLDIQSLLCTLVCILCKDYQRNQEYIYTMLQLPFQYILHFIIASYSFPLVFLHFASVPMAM